MTIILSRSTIEISKAGAKELEVLPFPKPVSSVAGLSFYTHARKVSNGSDDSEAIPNGPSINRKSKDTGASDLQAVSVSQSQSRVLATNEAPGPHLREIIDDRRREALTYQKSRETLRTSVLASRPSYATHASATTYGI